MKKTHKRSTASIKCIGWMEGDECIFQSHSLHNKHLGKNTYNGAKMSTHFSTALAKQSGQLYKNVQSTTVE